MPPGLSRTFAAKFSATAPALDARNLPAAIVASRIRRLDPMTKPLVSVARALIIAGWDCAFPWLRCEARPERFEEIVARRGNTELRVWRFEVPMPSVARRVKRVLYCAQIDAITRRSAAYIEARESLDFDPRSVIVRQDAEGVFWAGGLVGSPPRYKAPNALPQGRIIKIRPRGRTKESFNRGFGA